MAFIKEEKLYPLIALLLILIMALRTPLDSDMFWHLRAGEETWIAKDVYRVDTFSHTRQGGEWINHSWLSQVVMFLIFRLGDFRGLSIWVGLCAVASMFFLYLQLKGHPLIRSAMLLFAAIVSSVVWSPRPQIHSLILLSLLSYLIHVYKQTQNTRVLIPILPIFIIWGNLHAGYMLGVIYLLAFVLGEIINQVTFQVTPTSLTWKHILIVSSFSIGGFCAVLINPFGFDMWKIPFNTVGLETLQNVIQEWASPNFHQTFQQPMLLMLLALIGFLGLSKEEFDGGELIPVLVFSWAALTARRNFGPFAIVAAPALSRHASDVLGNWFKSLQMHFQNVRSFMDKAETNKEAFNPAIRNLINGALIVFLLGGVFWKGMIVVEKSLVQEAQSAFYPSEAVAWMELNDINGKIYNDYNWGGYLIWHLRDTPVFVDGRTDLFGDEIISDYLQLMSGESSWQSIIEKYQIQNMLIKNGSALSQLAIMDGWIIQYEDDNAILLTKK